MLDVENEETKEKDREKRKEILRKTEKLRDAKLQTVLFGNLGNKIATCIHQNV